MSSGTLTRAQLFRRAALAAGAGALASSPRAWALPRLAADADFVPAVVIGSGFGGSVAALRLGEAGVDTVVLERGRRWPIQPDGNTFATFEQPDGRAYWLRDRTGEAILGLPQLEKQIDRYVGVLEVVEGNGIFIGAGDARRRAGSARDPPIRNRGARRWVTPLVVLWAGFAERRVEYDGITHVHRDELVGWLRSLPAANVARAELARVC